MGSQDAGDLLVQAFVLENTDEEFELEMPPTSGHDYLKRVMQEAQDCPDIVVADFNREEFHRKQTFRPNCAGCQPAPTGYAPTKSWQKAQVVAFSNVRQAFVRHKARWKKEQTSTEELLKLPLAEDAEKWCKFCFGKYNPKILDSSMDDGSIQMLGDDSLTLQDHDQTDSKYSEGIPPLLNVLVRFNQKMVLNVLEYHLNWFEATGFSMHQGCWFYGLLTCLEKPLTPEACSLLRSLARNCSNLRASLDTAEDPILVPLNLLICLVARYFDQTDLADDVT